MKRGKLSKSVIALCLMLMLAWTTAGCGNIAGSASLAGDAGLLTEDGKGFRDTLAYMAMDSRLPRI